MVPFNLKIARFFNPIDLSPMFLDQDIEPLEAQLLSRHSAHIQRENLSLMDELVDLNPTPWSYWRHPRYHFDEFDIQPWPPIGFGSCRPQSRRCRGGRYGLGSPEFGGAIGIFMDQMRQSYFEFVRFWLGLGQNRTPVAPEPTPTPIPQEPPAVVEPIDNGFEPPVVIDPIDKVIEPPVAIGPIDEVVEPPVVVDPIHEGIEPPVIEDPIGKPPVIEVPGNQLDIDEEAESSASNTDAPIGIGNTLFEIQTI